MNRFFITLLVLFFSSALFGQMKPLLQKSERPVPLTPESIAPPAPVVPGIPTVANPLLPQRNFRALPVLPKPVKGQPALKAYIAPETGTPYQINGIFRNTLQRSPDALAEEYFSSIQPCLKLADPMEELVLTRVKSEPNGQTHLRYQQVWNGIPVYAAEVAVHQNAEGVYLFNGRYYPTPEIANPNPVWDKQMASQAAIQHVGQFEAVTDFTVANPHLTGGKEQVEGELVVYHVGQDPAKERLCWHLTVMPNMTASYNYIVDANTGEIVSYHSELCKLLGHVHSSAKIPAAASLENHRDLASPPPPDGPYTANANDLFGQSRSIHTYCKSNIYYMIDASKSMFNSAQSQFPDDPVGTIWTIDAQNTSPENANFSLAHVTSANNSWNNPRAVTAHYHAERSYEYYKSTFNRESINGQGGNIVSLINVVESDNSQMDNAFWNGAAMFYGNGNAAFAYPLMKGLDVTGHELTHGVIQSTANLEYQGQSGALNESFADVFGAMIDRNDWILGEDVVDTDYFPTGAMRDMSNPHNGGNSLADPGWQPAHMNEIYTGTQDNGGVHINSGIPNKAFYLFAEAVGKDKAEQIYYRALDEYLLKSSIFIDCRNAVIQAATDLYGTTEVNAAKAAFDAVGIGAGAGTDPTTDIGTNPGDEYIIMTDDAYSALYIFTPDGEEIANPLTTQAVDSRPSVTDDGSAFVYIAGDRTMRAVVIDWESGNVDEFTIQAEPIWRNVAISKDGARLAALTTDNDNILWIYDYGLEQWVDFELYNPTTGQGGPTTGDVQYADVIEWDFTGEWVMYDAFNVLNTASGNGIQYWDISFINVWSGNNFSNGYVEKLFTGLEEGISIGNPTFSKNSDYIVAFDYIDDYNGENYLLAVNIQSGDVGTVFQNNGLSWPNYSVDDNQMVFDAFDNNQDPVLAFIGLASDKINASGNASVFIGGGRWGVWFANGSRPLATTDIIAGKDIRISPNPVSDLLNLEFFAENAGDVRLQVFDLMGRNVISDRSFAGQGENHRQLNMTNLTPGTYFVRFGFEDGQAVIKFIKK